MDFIISKENDMPGNKYTFVIFNLIKCNDLIMMCF